MSMMRKQWGLIALATPLLLAGSLALPTTKLLKVKFEKSRDFS